MDSSRKDIRQAEIAMSLTPSIVLCKLYERQARKSGQTYFAGRLGAASVVLLRTDETSDSGQPVWVLKVSEPLPRTDATQLRKPDESDQAAADRGFARTADEIPF